MNESRLPLRDRHPEDYARNARGQVSIIEFNRWLPWYRCTDCGMWLYADQEHTLATCERRREALGA